MADETETEDAPKPSARWILYREAKKRGMEAWCTKEGQVYVDVPVGNRNRTFALESPEFNGWLRHVYEERRSNMDIATEHLVGEVTAQIGHNARFRAPRHDMAIRVARTKDEIYVCLANEALEFVKITAAGWELVGSAPQKFASFPGMLPLPRPEKGGTLDALRAFIPVQDDDDYKLLVGWLLGAYLGEGVYPILQITGPHGSAKSTLTTLLRGILDPSASDRINQPTNERDLLAGVRGTHILAIDNVSKIPGWLSDQLCQIATGTALSTRQLYTTADNAVYRVAKPIILNGITQFATMPDLKSRIIHLELPIISRAERRDPEELRLSFQSALPAILGGLYDVLSSALRDRPGVHLTEAPRLSNLALWVTAAEGALGWPGGSWMRVFSANEAENSEEVMDGNLVAAAVSAAIEEEARLTGTMQDILGKLAKFGPLGQSNFWPQTARGLKAQLDLLQEPLSRRNIFIYRGARTSKGATYIIEKQSTKDLHLEP